MNKNKSILIVTLVLLAIAAYFIITRKSGTILQELKDFAVQDTSSITKIFMADRQGNSVTLTKQKPGLWKLNEKYSARNDAMNLLLYTIKNIEVRSPVAKAAYNNILKDLSSSSRKVEIYSNDKLIKTYYVGGPTQDMMGTFMFLENSSVPFVIHIPGFEGYLSTRYITVANDWKIRSVFAYSLQEIKEVISQDLYKTSNSFMISKISENEHTLAYYPSQQLVSGAVEDKIQDYLSHYSFINYEGDSHEKASVLDSVFKAGPFRIIAVTDLSGITKTIRFFHMPVSQGSKQIFSYDTGVKLPFDNDRLYLTVDNDPAFLVGQYFTFGALFKTPDHFKMQASEQPTK